MSKAWKLMEKLRQDEDGAALIEYTVLLGILVVAVIATIVAVGGWVSGKWTAVTTAINSGTPRADALGRAVPAPRDGNVVHSAKDLRHVQSLEIDGEAA